MPLLSLFDFLTLPTNIRRLSQPNTNPVVVPLFACVVPSTLLQKFGEHRPARAAVEVARLPRDVKVEIECVAVMPKYKDK